VTKLSTFASENSALGAERSVRELGNRRGHNKLSYSETLGRSRGGLNFTSIFHVSPAAPKTEQGCESRTPPPSSWPPQGDHSAQDPLAHPSGSLRFYAEIRGFCEKPNLARRQTTGCVCNPSPPQKAQIGAKCSKPRDDPQTRPVLRNPVKHGTFAISNRREVLAKNASGSDMKNLTIAPRGSVTSSQTERSGTRGDCNRLRSL
jgi:hypothetical protein